MLELIYTSTKVVTTGTDLAALHMYYLATWDAMILHDYNSSVNKAYKLFRDGSQAEIISVVPSIKLIGRRPGRHCWMNVHGFGNGEIWEADEISGNYHSDLLLNPNWTPPIEAWHEGSFIDDLRQIAVYQSYGIVYCIDLTTGATLGTLNPGATLNHIAWVGDGQVVGVEYSTGKVIFIDYMNRLVLSQTKVAPCKAAAYDCAHRLVITLGSDKLVRVYTLDVVPAVLANPVFIPATSQHRLMGSKVRTRLTGDAGEPCKDYWIRWSLLGLPKGELLKDKSKTDVDGYADNYYFGLDETGEDTLQVSVQVPS